jgi:hypothetical protein
VALAESIWVGRDEHEGVRAQPYYLAQFMREQSRTVVGA